MLLYCDVFVLLLIGGFLIDWGWELKLLDFPYMLLLGLDVELILFIGHFIFFMVGFIALFFIRIKINL